MQEIDAGTLDEKALKKFFEILSSTNVNGMAQVGGEGYILTFDDVKQLHDIYCKLETDIKNSDKQTGAVYINEIESYLICALKHEARNISDNRELEYKQHKAKLKAKAAEETPATWRNWWWPFKLQRNRAQQLVDDEAAINAAYLHNIKQAELDRLESELEQIEVGYVAGEYLSLRKRIKLRRKIAKHKRALRRLEKRYGTAEVRDPANVQNVEPDNVVADPLSITATAAAKNDTKPTKKPNKKAIKPVVIEEIPGQLPGQMSIENANTTN